MNKKFVRAFALVLAALMCLSLLPLAARADEGHVCQFTPVRTEPTCGEEGYVQMTCEVCGNAGEIIEFIPPTGAHTFMDVMNDDYLFEESDNLCLRPARYWKACAVCGAAAEEAHTEALNKLYEEINQRKNNGEQHTNEEWQKITEDAVKEVDAQYTFSFGGEGHSWVSYERQEATCTEDGWEAYRQCSTCGAIDGEYPRIPAKGHRWGEFAVTKEPTCTEDGSKERVCEVCGEKETAAIPAKGHTWGEFTVITEPKCVEDGLKEHTCTVCGAKETAAIPALGHTWGAFTVITEPKCEEDGLQEHICEVCEATESVAIPALGHTWGAFTVTRPATCTVDGEQERTCAACGKKETEIIPAGHKWGEWAVTVEPGCYSSGEQTRTCMVCGEKETEAIAPAHKFGEWVVVMEPTCYSTGEERSTCTVCGETESRWLDMAHKYENGVCVFCGEAQPDAPAVTGTEEPAAEAEETGTEENNTEEGSTEEHTNDTDETPANEPEAQEEPAAEVPYTGIQNADAVKNGEIVDEAYVGNVLTAAVTPADHEYIYQWYRIAGEQIEEISGAYDKSYRLTEDDVDASVYCYVDDEEGSDATTYAVAVLSADQDPNPAPAEETAAEEAEKSNTLEEAETFAAAEPTVTRENSSAETIADFAEKTGIAADPASITAQNVTPVGANGEKLDNDAVAAAGGVTFEMPLPENYKSGDDIEIYHQNSETGAWEKITNYNVDTENNKVIITAQKDFSAFIVVDKNGNLVEAETFGASFTSVTIKVGDEARSQAFVDEELTAVVDPPREEGYYGYQWLRQKDKYSTPSRIKDATAQKYTLKEGDCTYTIMCSVYVDGHADDALTSTGVLARMPIDFPVTCGGEGVVTITIQDPVDSSSRTIKIEDGIVVESDDPAISVGVAFTHLPTMTEDKITFTMTPNSDADYKVRGLSEFDENGGETVLIPATKSTATNNKPFIVETKQKAHRLEILFDQTDCDAKTDNPMQRDDIEISEDVDQTVLNAFLDTYVKPGDKYAYYYVAPTWHTAVTYPLTPAQISTVGPFYFTMNLPNGVTKEKVDNGEFKISVYHYSFDKETGWRSGNWVSYSSFTVTDEDKVQITNCSSFSPFAVLAQESITITFDPGTATGTAFFINDIKGTQIEIPKPESSWLAPTDQTFAYWKNGAEEYRPGESFILETSITITAQWMDGCTITFDKVEPGATGEMDDKYVPKDEEFELPPLGYHLDDHKFVEWIDDDGNKYTYDDPKFTPTKNLNLKAHWEQTHSTITFHGNGSSSPDMQPVTAPLGGMIVLPANTYEAPNNNLVFAGWSETESGNVVYKDQARFDTPPKSMPLFAVWRTKVKITFYPESNSGTGTAGSGVANPYTQIVPSGEETPLTKNRYTAPAGKVFHHWSINPDGRDPQYTDEMPVNLTGNTNLFAWWSSEKCEITFEPHGGTGEMAKQTVAKNTETKLNPNEITAPEGKAFDYWSVNEDGTGDHYADNAPIKPKGEEDTITLYAQWKDVYTITFDDNGGEGKIDPLIFDQSATDTPALPSEGFTRTDYKLIGWTETEGGTTVQYQLGGSAPKKSTKLFAVWKQYVFTVTFNKGEADGSETMEPERITSGEPKKLTKNAFTYTAHLFKNWKDQDNKTYKDEQKIKSITKNLNLTAQWDEAWTISFDKNHEDATGEMDDLMFVKGVDKPLPDPNSKFTRENYEIIGWTEIKGGTTPVIALTANAPQKDTTLYAVWQRQKVKLTLDANNKTAPDIPDKDERNIDKALAYELPKFDTLSFEYPNRTFICWNTVRNPSEEDPGTIFEDRETIPASMTTKDVTLYAQWDYAITFDKGHEDAEGEMEPQTFKRNEPFTINANGFTRTNYDFNGWKDEDGNTYTNGQPNVKLTKSHTFTAQWKKNYYSVTYVNPDDNTGKVYPGIPTSEKVTLIECPFEAREGKIFAEWNTAIDKEGKPIGTPYYPGDEIGTTLDDTKTPPEPKDITLYAIWKDYVTVYFYPADGSFATQNVPVNTNTKLKTYNALGFKDKTPEGQTFAYWVDAVGTKYFDGQEVNLAENLTLQAVYGNSIDLVYNANGGTITYNEKTGSSLRATIAKDMEYQLYTEEYLQLKRSGYDFLGWALGAGADEPKKDEKDDWRRWKDSEKTISNEPIIVKEGFPGETTIYAVWEQLDFEGIVTITGSVTDMEVKGLVGETLTADVNGDKEFFDYKYQWLRDGVEIPNPLNPGDEGYDPDYGKHQTYTVTAADFEHRITCRVTAEDAKGEKTKLSINYKEIELDAISKEIDIVDNLPEDEDDYLLGLTNGMKYSFNSTDPKDREYVDDKLITINGVKAFPFFKQGTYRFYDTEGTKEQGSMIAVVEVRNWWSLSYTITNKVTTSSSSSSSSSGSKTSTSSTSTTSSGGGTVRMYNGGTQLTATSRINDKSGNLIIQGTGTTSWLVREGANTDLKMIVTPSSNSFAYVSLNGSSYSSFGSGEKTITVSPMEGPEHYEIVFANATSSPKTADESHLGMWSALCFTSLVAASAILTRSRRRRKNEK